jgi:four helix bundle protein
MQPNVSTNLIVQLTFAFSLDVIAFCEQLQAEKKFLLANQLFRSGTSIGANVREAQGAESKSDFIHKMKIAYKEAEETQYWLEICENAPSYRSPSGLRTSILAILRVLAKIILSSKRAMPP